MTSETPEPAPTGPASNDPMARVVEILRRNPWARRGLSAVSVLLLAGAIGMIGFPYISNVLQSREQSNLDRQLDSDELAQAYRNRRVAIGDALTRVKIPAIDVDVVVVEGTTASALRAGAGHYPATPLPCEKGNVAIAGHRTTYGRPFHNLDLLKNKDLIILETPIGTCTYEVSVEPFAVQPDDISVVANTPNDATLTLTTCHPKGSARQRLVIHAKMIKSEFYDA